MATSEQLEQEVDRTRGRIEETLSQLHERLSPNLLIDDLFDYAQANGGADFVRNLGRQVAGNPLPVALMGAGLAWLMFAPNRGGDMLGSVQSRLGGLADSFNEWKRTEAMANNTSDRRSDSRDSNSDGLYGKASDAMGRASEAVGGARERMSDLAGKARETTSGAYQKVSNSVSSAMDTVSSKMPSTSRVTNFIQEEPMVLAGIGVALGAIIGAMLPTTRMEEEYVGPTAGALKEQAKDAAREQWERGKEMAAEGWDQAKDAAQRTWEDAKDEAQKSWDNTQQGGVSGSRTPLVPSEQGDSTRMADATSRSSNS
jgi:ElaB/YqjD/DUF883 family membrane-anchored ribosome-binding protein